MTLDYILKNKEELEKLMNLSIPYEQRRAIRKTIGEALNELKEFETERDTKIKNADLVTPEGTLKKGVDEIGNPIPEVQKSIIEINAWIDGALKVDVELPQPTFKFNDTNVPQGSVYADQILIDFGLLEDN